MTSRTTRREDQPHRARVRHLVPHPTRTRRRLRLDPVLDRCSPVRMRLPTRSHHAALTSSMGADLRRLHFTQTLDWKLDVPVPVPLRDRTWDHPLGKDLHPRRGRFKPRRRPRPAGRDTSCGTSLAARPRTPIPVSMIGGASLLGSTPSPDSSTTSCRRGIPIRDALDALPTSRTTRPPTVRMSL